jgi:geranylgeranyl pyrophosphate synthase
MVLDWLPKDTAQAVDQLDLKLMVQSVPEIDHLLSKTVLFRGKKFRPMLCFLMGKLFRMSPKEIHPYARAAEFVHAATLAHDDVIDESMIRRNRPTLNARSSNARAVLAGDLLLARVMTELSSLGQIKIIQDLSRTVEELVHGEWLQLEARNVVRVSRNHLETVAKKKTASLMMWCCSIAPLLSGKGQSEIEICRGFGEALGISFQMIDDIIDYDPQGEKPFAHDLREGLINCVTYEMLEENPVLIEPVQKLLGTDCHSGPWPWKSGELDRACDRVRVRAQAKLEVAEQLLTQISNFVTSPDPDALQALRMILVYLRERIR